MHSGNPGHIQNYGASKKFDYRPNWTGYCIYEYPWTDVIINREKNSHFKDYVSEASKYNPTSGNGFSKSVYVI